MDWRAAHISGYRLVYVLQSRIRVILYQLLDLEVQDSEHGVEISDLITLPPPQQKTRITTTVLDRGSKVASFIRSLISGSILISS